MMKYFTRIRQVYVAICFAIQNYRALVEMLDASDDFRLSDPGSNQPAGAYGLRSTVPPDAVPCTAVTCPPAGLTFDGVVTRVIDGDTVEVQTTLTHRIRLIDCWCEETRLGRNTDEAAKARGLEARHYLAWALLPQTNNEVRVHIPGHGGDLSQLATLGRVLGRMWLRCGNDVQIMDVSSQMVAAGLATRDKPVQE